MRIIAPTNGPFELPSPGWHRATIVEVEDLGVNPYDRKKERHRLLIKLKLEDGKIQFHWANATLGYKSTFRPLVEAAMGSIPLVFETPDLVGKTCEVFIEHYDAEDKVTKQKIRRAKVTQVRPLLNMAA
jgi:hypothetical protein